MLTLNYKQCGDLAFISGTLGTKPVRIWETISGRTRRLTIYAECNGKVWELPPRAKLLEVK